VDIVNKKTKTYKKSVPKLDSIDPLVILAAIVDQAAGNTQIKISSIQNDKCNAGKVFNLDIITLTSLLNKLEHMGYIKVIRTAGLDYIDIIREIDFLGCVREYYARINK
jgi:hypothetical protein